MGDSITNDAKHERMPVIAGSVRAVAEETGAELVDLYALTEEKRELFGPDGLHPSAEGARVIAEAVCERIRNSRVPDQAEPGNPEQGGYNH